jgi:exonuclease III
MCNDQEAEPHTQGRSQTPSATTCFSAPPCKSDSIRWRIDYQIATPGLAKYAKTAIVERAEDHPSRRSDHAPVTVTYAA